MRISDGSSDVCSSDLDIAERRTRIRGTILCNSLLLFGNLQRLDREIGFLAAVETDNHRIDLLAGLEAVGTLFVTVAAKIATLDEASCTVFTGLDFKAAIADFRSEEHTSELQSLMRISYAVFCLKKNITKYGI